MTKKQNRLLLRKHTYYARIAVPRELVFTVKRSEVKCSLKTKNYYEACQKVRIISVMMDSVFNKIRKNLMKIDDVPEEKATDVFLDKTDFEKFFIYELGRIKDVIDNNYAEIQQGKVCWDDITWLNDTEKEKFAEETESAVESDSEQYMFTICMVQKCFDNYLQNVIKEESNQDWDKFKRIFSHKPLYKMTEAQIRERMQYLNIILDGMADIEKYAKNYISSLKNNEEYRELNPQVSKWLNIIQKKEMEKFSSPVLTVEWKDVIEEYNRSKKVDYMDKDSTIKRNQQKIMKCFNLIGKNDLSKITAQDCSCLSAKLEGSKNLAVRTRKNYLIVFKNFIRWCYREKYIANDYSSNIVIPTNKIVMKAGISEREPLDKKDVLRFFMPEQFLDQVSSRERIWRFYIPLIALTTGARINEICQLDVSDIKKEQGIWYYDFNNDDEAGKKSLKTEKSKRKVPVHSIVLEQDFLEYVKCVKAGGKKKLFSDLTYSADSNYSHKATTYFSKYIRKKAGITDKNKTFHSFRHLFKQLMEKAKIRTETQNAICGWEGDNIGERVYGKIEMKEKKEAIETIKFDFIQKALQEIKHKKPDFMKFR